MPPVYQDSLKQKEATTEEREWHTLPPLQVALMWQEVSQPSSHRAPDHEDNPTITMPGFVSPRLVTTPLPFQ